MKKLLLLLSFCFLFVISGRAELKTYTEDLSTNVFNVSVASTKTTGTNSVTSSKTGLSYVLNGPKGNGYYFDKDNLMMGKEGAYIETPAFKGVIKKL